LDQPDTVRVSGEDLARHTEGQGRLPDAGGPGDRHQTGALEGLDQTLSLALAPDHLGRHGREVPLRGGQRPNRGEAALQAIDGHLIETLIFLDVLETMHPQVLETDALAQVVLDQTGGDGRENDLAPVTRRADPGRQMDVEADVVGTAEHRLAR